MGCNVPRNHDWAAYRTCARLKTSIISPRRGRMDPGEGGNSLTSSQGLNGLKSCLDLSGLVSSGELWEGPGSISVVIETVAKQQRFPGWGEAKMGSWWEANVQQMKREGGNMAPIGAPNRNDQLSSSKEKPKVGGATIPDAQPQNAATAVTSERRNHWFWELLYQTAKPEWNSVNEKFGSFSTKVKIFLKINKNTLNHNEVPRWFSPFWQHDE